MKTPSNKKFWEVKASAESSKIGEVYIYGGIYSYKDDDDDVTAKSFNEDLKALGDIDTLNIYVNSPGGSVFQAQAIHSIITRQKAEKNAYIDGLAASAASFLIMAADKIYMPKNATMMIHNPIGIVIGNAADMRQQADALDKITVGLIEAYLSHAGDKLDEEQLKNMLDAETWLTAEESYNYGLADEVLEIKNVAACVDMDLFGRYKNAPQDLLALQGAAGEKERREKIAAEAQQLHDRVAQTLTFRRKENV